MSRIANTRDYLRLIFRRTQVHYDSNTLALVLLALDGAGLLNDPGPDAAEYARRVQRASREALDRVMEPGP